jgi:ElaB/YqjD/DUF883 family membrane-anchored ribosome-binding protein
MKVVLVEDVDEWTSYETRQQSFQLQATVTDLLNGKIEPTVDDIEDLLPAPEITGEMRSDHIRKTENQTPTITFIDKERIQSILAETKALFSTESKIKTEAQNHLKSLEEMVSKYKNQPGQSETSIAILAELDALVSSLDSLLKNHQSFLNMKSEEILSQWASAQIQDHQARYQLLQQRLQQLRQRAMYFREQVRQGAIHLEPHYTKTNYSSQIAELNRAGTRRWASFAVKHTLAAALIAGGVFFAFDEGAESILNQKWTAVQEWYKKITGKDEEPVIRYYDPAMQK